jgi:nicotinamide-nucleotide adenylyltransferase
MIKMILEDYDEVTIGVGSAQYTHTKKNPFTAEERTEMIKRALEKESINSFSIVPIDDVHNDDLWVKHVESLVPRFDAVITHDSLSRKLFSDSGYDIVDARLLEREKYSGTEVRMRLLKGDDWLSLVPKEVAKYILEIGGEKRMREIKSG